MAVNINNKQVVSPTPDKLVLDKSEATLVVSMLAEAQIKVKDIQKVYDLVYKIQEFIN